MCGTAFLLAGTSATAGTDGIHQKQTKEKKQGKKNNEEIIQKIEADSGNSPATRAGKSGI